MTPARSLVRTLSVLLGVAAAAVIALRVLMPRDRMQENKALPDYGAVPAFTLTERSGRTVANADLKGKVWAADFIFTRCTGPCPLLTKRVALLQTEFAKRPDFRLVSFSVDPSYDTPAVLTAYAAGFKADPEKWLFLTGPVKEVHDLVVAGFHLALQQNPDPKAKPGEGMVHNLELALVDGAGRIRGYYAGTDDADIARLRRDLDRI